MQRRILNYAMGLFIILLFALSSSFMISTEDRASLKEMTYHIRPPSKLEINGQTNINSFCCISQERFPKKKVNFELDDSSPFIRFENTYLKIKTNLLDCASKPINKDLRKALQADQYPEISIKLLDALNLECLDLKECGEWFDFMVQTEITITCETQPTTIPVSVSKLDQQRFRIIGGTALKLCDFEIEAPTALMGLIKVKDTIDIQFDLYVDLK